MFLQCPQIVPTLNPTKSESFPAQNNCSPGIKRKHSSLEWKNDSKKNFFQEDETDWRNTSCGSHGDALPRAPFKEGLAAQLWSLNSTPPLAVSCFRVGLRGRAASPKITSSPGAAAHTRWLSRAGYKGVAMSAQLRTLWQAIFAPELPAKVAEALLGLTAVGFLPLPSPASTHFLAQVLIPNKHLYLYICFWRRQPEAPDLH